MTQEGFTEEQHRYAGEVLKEISEKLADLYRMASGAYPLLHPLVRSLDGVSGALHAVILARAVGDELIRRQAEFEPDPHIYYGPRRGNG